VMSQDIGIARTCGLQVRVISFGVVVRVAGRWAGSRVVGRR